MSSAGVGSLAIDDVTKHYGKPYPFDFYPQSFRDEMYINLKKAIDTNEIIEQESAVLDTRGNKVWFHSTISPVSDIADQVEYLMVVSIDTTAQHIATTKLKHLNDDLETKINERTLELENKNIELQQTIDDFKRLKDFLPICSYCKKIRDDEGSWEQIESYITTHADTSFSHGICPDCYVKVRDEFGLNDK
jgi:hypothetical protein